jgi:protein involved in polysaccharide export with SLBB domain
MDFPAGPDYVLGPGDALNVNIWGSQSITLSATVDRQGQIALPESGSIAISGLTIAAAQTVIQKSLRTQFKDMHVEISLGRVRTVRVYVVGDVQRPGAYDISSLSTPLNALYAAGGPTSTGSLRILRHYRGKQLVNEIDLYDFLLRGVRSSTENMLPGDTILVPPVGPQVTINGMVRRPAIYELKGQETLKDALEMAGGVMVAASLQQVSVERVEAHQRRTMISVQVPRGQEGGNARNASHDAGESKETELKQLASFQMQDGDAVLVRPILPYNEAVVFLDGHVFRPGKYPYREGMTVNDLLHRSQDIMPEPADRLELVRLVGADYHPETTLLNLQEVLQGSSTILLKPFDYLRVFSRYEVDSPTVTIAGDVIRPGEYPLSSGMKVSALVQMAGGFRRSAYRAAADLATYSVEDGKKALIRTSVIDLDKAMSGDSTADVKLQAGELLSIREITGWQDIGSSVTVSGEVVHAGTYGIVNGERLSSVIKRAGGFRDVAYPQGIVLERTAVRALGEKARADIIQRIESQDLSGQVIGGDQDNAQSQAETFQMMRAQQQEALTALRSNPANGRIVVKIGKDISKWENSPADPEMRADDTIYIPKRNDFVVVVGQVYDQTSFSYLPGKTVRWYLQQAGGTNRNAARGDIYVIRADGSHISRDGLFSSSVLSARLQPGDSIVVPEKFVGTPIWKTLLSAAESMTMPAMLGVVATK